jgi:hypothetical protein
VWVVCGYLLVTTGLSVIVQILAFTGRVPLKVGSLQYVVSACDSILIFVGSFLLFRLKKRAVLVFGLLLALSVASDLTRLLTTSPSAELGFGLGILTMLVGLTIETAVLVYALRLRKRGILT